MAQDITQQIKDYARSHAKIDLIGIAPVSRFNGAPEGFHPTDFLPGCKSVIVCAVRLPDGAVQAIMRMLEDGLSHAHGIYGSYGYVGGPNYTLLFAADKIARFVEDLTGEIAVPCPSGPTHGAKMLSVRHSAVAAGLGEFGWHSCVITPEFGTRNRFVTIPTTAELVPDPLYGGRKLCDPEHCHVCSTMCPSGAIPKYAKAQARVCDIGGKTCAYSGLDADKCKMTGAGVFAEFNETGDDLFDTDNRHPLSFEADKMQAYYFEHPNNNFFVHFTSWKCGYCLAYCPAGGWKERFYDRGLSRIDTSMYITK
jgi:epoxyqueuosine reductase QueG